jgi:hypothetical protein
MKSTWILLVASLLLLGLISANAAACGGNCVGCCGTTAQASHRVVLRMDVKQLPHQLVQLAAKSVKWSAHYAAKAPHELARQMRTGTGKVQVACQAATGQTQSTFQRVSAEVTSLSLQVLRGACSYFLALFSGLLR